MGHKNFIGNHLFHKPEAIHMQPQPASTSPTQRTRSPHPTQFPALFLKSGKARKKAPYTPPELLNLSRAYIALALPGEFNLKTGQLLDALLTAPFGLTKREILEKLFPEYQTASPKLQRTLECRTDKILQRARKRYTAYGVHIHWTRNVGRFAAHPGELCG
jgi:hypothetical protein